jgi:hypothetical protein
MPSFLPLTGLLVICHPEKESGDGAVPALAPAFALLLLFSSFGRGGGPALAPRRTKVGKVGPESLPLLAVL